jgi:hypothetical protein
MRLSFFGDVALCAGFLIASVVQAIDLNVSDAGRFIQGELLWRQTADFCCRLHQECRCNDSLRYDDLLHWQPDGEQREHRSSP